MDQRVAALGYRPALDGLRAVAVVLVMLQHLNMLVPGDLVRAGNLGVDLFFVLSGFLITTLLVERMADEPSLMPFYRRRALRLLPAVTLLVLVQIGVTAALAPAELGATVTSGLLAMVYVLNWFADNGVVESMKHLWSLSIEEQFYIVWPAVLMLALRSGVSRRRVATAALVLAAAIAVWRGILLHDVGLDQWRSVYFRTDARADALLIGSAAALLGASTRRLSAAAASSLGSIALAAFVAMAVVGGDYWYVGGFTIVAVLSVVMILCALDDRWALHRLLSSRPLVRVGRMSYSLYLWHWPVILAVHTWLPVSRPLQFVAAIVVTAATSMASYHLIEMPFLRLKDGRRRRVRTAEDVPRVAVAPAAGSTLGS